MAHDRDGNGDFLGSNELVVVDSGDWSVSVGDLALDSVDRVAYLFWRNDDNALRLAYDRSGDGDFDDTVGVNPELSTIVSGSFVCAGLSFDSSDRLAVVYATSSGTTKLLRDLNGDGDFADGAGEFSFLSLSQAQGGCDIVGGAGLGLAATQTVAGELRLLVDRNDDGDFVDTDEDVLLDSANTDPVELRRDASGRAVAATPTELFADPI